MAFKSFKQELVAQLTIAVGVVLVLILASLFVGFDVKRVSEGMSSRRLEFAGQNRAISQLASLKSDAKEAETFLPFLETILPTRDQLLAFPSEVQRIGVANNVITTFAFGAELPAADGLPGAVRFSLTGRGSYSDVRSLVRTVESLSTYFTSFENFDIVRQGQSEFKLVTDGKVFFR